MPGTFSGLATFRFSEFSRSQFQRLPGFWTMIGNQVTVFKRGTMYGDGPINNEGGVRGKLPPFDELFKLHCRRVYAVCLRMTGNTSDAEDLSQEVFFQVFRKLHTFRGESSFTSWLHRLTVNHVLMHFRKRRSRREHLTDDGELPEQKIQCRRRLASFPILDRIALDEAILELPPGYRIVFVLHDIEGLDHLEIANILGCSVGATKSQLHKARMKLRRLLLEGTHLSKASAFKASRRFKCRARPGLSTPLLLPTANSIDLTTS